MSVDRSPDLAPLLAVMARLRDPVDGCAWDLAQTFATIAPYTIEEAYEVADAIARQDLVALRDELGDLLLQVVFHAQMAAEQNAFAIGDVIATITAKMVRRHPHVFGDTMAPVADWEAIKAAERAKDADRSALAGVARALPALIRADKIQRRAARVGFDWLSADGALEKVREELDELSDAGDGDEWTNEFGDLLFSLVNLARHRGVDAEAALNSATAKFERRFRAMEGDDPTGFATLSPGDQDARWRAVKRAE